MRLAWLSPLPPAATGIADYTADLLHLLAEGHEIDAFHAQQRVDGARLPSPCGIHEAREFLERQRARPYDLAVYQMGNGPQHAFLYDSLSRVPGLLVLHDLVLHHSRAAHFLEADEVRAWRSQPGNPGAREAALPWLERWRAELSYTYPDRGARLFEAHLGTVGDLLPYAYPLIRLPVEASLAVAVHNSWMVEAVEEEVPGAEVLQVPMATRPVPVPARAVEAARRRLGFSEGDFVVGTFGLLTPEKQVETVARAVARAAAWRPEIRLLLAGPVPDEARLKELVQRLGVGSRTTITGCLPLDELPPHFEVADVVVQLRYPTARETSAALLRVLAQGRPTVISDLEHQAEIPEEAVVRADMANEEGAVTRALLKLAEDPAWRRTLGGAAAAWVERVHSPAATRAAWETVLEQVGRRSASRSPADWPAHWPRP